MQLLLVDSDQVRTNRLKERLSALGVSVVTAKNELESREAIDRSRFSMTLCHWQSQCCHWSQHPEELIEQLKSRSEVTICVVSGDDIEAIESGLSLGFQDYLFFESSETVLQTKLNHANHMQRVSERLAQAQKLESIGELAAGIAHEINTPIQYVGDNTRFVRGAYDDLLEVLSSCQALIEASSQNDNLYAMTASLRDAMDNADVDYLLEEIPSAIDQTLDGIDRVTNIVRAMKEFSHPGATELTLTDLSQAIENTVMVARNEWKYVAEMKTEYDPDLPAVPCLPGELNQVLLNMIVNASHAIADSLGDSPDSKGEITIRTSLATPYAEICVSDSGVGIASENIERVFTPFFTTKAAGKGTGQGLAIAHSVVVEKHGGTIHVESELGKGTTFVIRLPLETRRSPSDLEQASDSALV